MRNIVDEIFSLKTIYSILNKGPYLLSLIVFCVTFYFSVNYFYSNEIAEISGLDSSIYEKLGVGGLFLFFVYVLSLLIFVFLFHGIREKSLSSLVYLYLDGVVFFGCVYYLLNVLYPDVSHLKDVSVVFEPENYNTFSGLAFFVLDSMFQHVYFSLINMSTVGFGDVHPVSNYARFIVSVQILFGLYMIVIAISSGRDQKQKEEEEKAKAPLLACARTDVSDFLYEQMAFINYLCLQSEVLGDKNHDDLYCNVMNDVVSGFREKRNNNELKNDQDEPGKYIEELSLLYSNVLNRYSMVLDEGLYYSIFYVDRFNRKYMLYSLSYNSDVSWKEYFYNISNIYDWCDSFETGDHSIMVDREIESIMKGHFRLRLK